MGAIFSKQPGGQTKTLPFFAYFWTVVILALAGLIDSIYLSISHYRVYTDISYQSFCAISRAINCDTVSQSPHSVLWGMPVPVWGIMGYFLFLLLLLFAKNNEAAHVRIWPLLFLLSLVFSVYSIILAVISTVSIRSLCIMCIVSYGVNFLLLYYTWMIRNRFRGDRIFKGLRNDLHFLRQRRMFSATVFVPFFTAVLITVIFFPVYWSFDPPHLAANIPFGVTPDGHPWVGAQNPEFIITEFTDYQCFQCNKMHFYLRQLLVNHPGKIRIVHRHFPMDHTVNPMVKKPIHIGSGAMAMLAIYAGTKDKFWPMSDLLFSIARKMHQIDAKFLADKTGLDAKKLSRALYDPAIRSKLNKDIVDVLKLGVRGTPTFVVNGNTYHGQIPPEVVAKVLN
ncbi:MAG: thioredoxin domain-containing protein [Deltaproteobacteria bacterium]|nr:MAG: thioredoxin domain-containing protein [Deltaproteobacteria bacterium]